MQFNLQFILSSFSLRQKYIHGQISNRQRLYYLFEFYQVNTRTQKNIYYSLTGRGWGPSILIKNKFTDNSLTDRGWGVDFYNTRQKHKKFIYKYLTGRGWGPCTLISKIFMDKLYYETVLQVFIIIVTFLFWPDYT